MDTGPVLAPAARHRRRKQSRCRSCEFSHPRNGGASDIRLCREPSRSPHLVLGDQMACTAFSPMAQHGRETVMVMPTRVEGTPISTPVQTEAGAAPCGDCRYHMPHATDPRSECTNPVSSLYEEEVFTGQPACGGFAAWPDGGRAALYLAAMRSSGSD